MPLNFPGAWRFRPPADGLFINSSIPRDAVERCIGVILRVATQGGRQGTLEHFKRHLCAASGASYSQSSNASWAETDLRQYAYAAAQNAPLFVEAFYDACQSFGHGDADAWSPDVDMINEILAEHRIGYVIRPPRLELREDLVPMVQVVAPPDTIAERAAGILRESLARSEQLLAQGRGREAVQESLWLLETVATAFRGVETAMGTIEGNYFNQIVRELRNIDGGGTLRRVLDWVSGLHGYLSSPTGGAVRHGLDLNAGVPIGQNEARLFCNLIQSYLSFLLVEHERLLRRQQQ